MTAGMALGLVPATLAQTAVTAFVGSTLIDANPKTLESVWVSGEKLP
jgi:hypothetical protein